jgi:tetratricopeptide (TPR) repeat protein
LEIRRGRRGNRPSPDDERFIRALVDLADAILDYADDVRDQLVASALRYDDLCAEARCALDEAEKIVESRYGRDHELHAGVLSARGRLHLLNREYEAARDCLSEAAIGLRRAGFVLQAQLVPTLFHLAQVRYVLNETEQAIALMREVCARDLAVYGPGHPEVVKNEELLEGMQQAEFMKRMRDVARQEAGPPPPSRVPKTDDVANALPRSGAMYFAFSGRAVSYVGTMVAHVDAGLDEEAALVWSSSYFDGIDDDAISWECLTQDGATVWRVFDVLRLRHFYVHRYEDAWRVIEALSHGGYEDVPAEALARWGRSALLRRGVRSPQWKPGPPVEGGRALVATLVPRYEGGESSPRA